MAEYDAALHSKVNQVQNALVTLNGAIDRVGTQVQVVTQEQHETRTELATLYRDFMTFRKQNEMDRAKQEALTRVGNLKAEFETQFGINNRVRNNALGMLQAFDVGIVTEETAQRVGEELTMEAKGYWLAPVLTAMAAWARDDREVCERAIEVAVGRSLMHTSLFMALVLRRQGRQASSVRWLRHYLESQDPRKLGRNFAVILEASSHGAFGPSGMALVQEFLARWSAQLAQDEQAQQHQVKLWRSEIEKHRSMNVADRYPRLAAISPQWPGMNMVLCGAEAHRRVLDKYTAMLTAELPPDTSIEDRVDDILDRLIREYDDPELPLRRNITVQEAIVNHDGDVDRAKQSVESTVGAMETTMDYLSVQTNSALNPAAIGVSPYTQRVAIASCQDWFGRAVTGYTQTYRAAIPSDVQATFGGNHNTGARLFNLPTWQGSFTRPMGELQASLSAHWDKHTGPFIESLNPKVGGQITAASIVSLAILVIIGAASWPVGIVLGLLVGGIWAAVIYSRVQQAREAQEKAKKFLADVKRDSLAQLTAAGAELTDWTTEFRRSDGVEAELRQFIAGLATAGHAATPFERRNTVTV